MDKPLTPEQYLDEKRFPLTTQTGGRKLSLSGQLMIDAMNLDGGREAIENGETLDQEGQARQAELEEKAKSAPALNKLCAEQEKAKRRAREAARNDGSSPGQ